MSYSDRLTVDRLRPAEANADSTFGKPIDILVNGTYAKIKGSELVDGTVPGKAYGSNLVALLCLERVLGSGICCFLAGCLDRTHPYPGFGRPQKQRCLKDLRLASDETIE